MYEDSVHRSRLVPAPVRWLRLWFASFVAVGIACAFFSGVGALIGCLAGCSGTASGRTYGVNPADVAARNGAAVPGFAGASDTAPAILDSLADFPSDLVAWGAPAILLGCVLIWRPEAPSGLGAGLVCGGLLLLLAGTVLPLFGGWLGLLVMVGAAAFYFLRKNPDSGLSPLNLAGNAVDSLLGRVKALFSSK